MEAASGGVAHRFVDAVILRVVNFLAHLLLSDATPAARVGNLLPDMHRGKLPSDLGPAVMAGVILHRRVDAFTDRHALFERSRQRVRDTHGRYAGVIVDVFYDHVLTREWLRYHDQPVEAFIDEVYADLRRAQQGGLMPEPMQWIISAMIDQDWLSTYRTLAGIELTLTRLSARLRERFGREVDLASATPLLAAQLPGFTDDFTGFFEDLLRYLHLERPAPRAPGVSL